MCAIIALRPQQAVLHADDWIAGGAGRDGMEKVKLNQCCLRRFRAGDYLTAPQLPVRAAENQDDGYQDSKDEVNGDQKC